MLPSKRQNTVATFHDLIYHGICPDKDCGDNYVGETARRFNERAIDHTGRDTYSHLYTHSLEKGHKSLELRNYKIIGNGYGKSTFRRKIAEVLLIKELRPTLISKKSQFN